MKIFNCEQGSRDWHAARAGCITASNFKIARSKLKIGNNKGNPTGAALDYAFRLAIERISGKPLDEGHETWAMRRGHELEPAARAMHAAVAGVVVDRAGFVTTDDGRFGASADGLIGCDGGSEYKCLVAPDGLRNVLLYDDIDDFIDQIQGCMWITGRSFWHFALYCPALESIGRQLYWMKIDRDENYIESLARDLWNFSIFVDDFEKRLREKIF